MALLKVQQDLQCRVNDLRCLHRLITSQEFEELYDKATDVQREAVGTHIREENRSEVERWIALLRRTTERLDDQPIRKLRTLASSLGIPGYHLLTKAELLFEIRKVMR